MRASMTTSPLWSYASLRRIERRLAIVSRPTRVELPTPRHLQHNRDMNAREFAADICATLRQAGFQAYLAVSYTHLSCGAANGYVSIGIARTFLNARFA